MVDHRIAHKGDRSLFWDRLNWQPMSHSCNSRKAIREEGGFGKRRGEGRDHGNGALDRSPSLARNFAEFGDFEP
jgi:5-methylcytosine-specific restriction endonuclease McrA